MNITLNLTPELRLEQALKNAGVAKPTSVAELTVSGMFTDDDFVYFLKNMGETLHELDLRDASIEREFSFIASMLYIGMRVKLSSSENSVLANKDRTEMFFCPEGWQGDYEIPASVIKIMYGIYTNDNLIPYDIGTYAFYNCINEVNIFIARSQVTTE